MLTLPCPYIPTETTTQALTHVSPRCLWCFPMWPCKTWCGPLLGTRSQKLSFQWPFSPDLLASPSLSCSIIILHIRVLWFQLCRWGWRRGALQVLLHEPLTSLMTNFAHQQRLSWSHLCRPESREEIFPGSGSPVLSRVRQEQRMILASAKNSLYSGKRAHLGQRPLTSQAKWMFRERPRDN